MNIFLPKTIKEFTVADPSNGVEDVKLRLTLDYQNKKTWLLNALMAYWRWKAEGEKPHCTDIRATHDNYQMWYDGRHEIQYQDDKDHYKFCFQEKEGWWVGRFDIVTRGVLWDIEIIEERLQTGKDLT